jgi:hypothetical protein
MMRRQPNIFRALALAVGVITLMYCGWGLIEYGTVAPCQMLAKEALRQAVADVDDFGAADALALAVASRAAEATAAQLGPVDCFSRLWSLRAER